METVFIGIMGGIGAGKSTVARMLGEHGALVLDADAMAHDTLEEADVRSAVRERFGESVFDAGGAVDRARLARAAFADGEALAFLGDLVHPRVRERISAEIGRAFGKVPAVVLDVPLLLESPLRSMCHHLVYVDAPESARLERVRRSRGWDGDEVRRRQAHQAALEDKRSAATDVINNHGAPEELERLIARLWEKYAARC